MPILIHCCPKLLLKVFSYTFVLFQSELLRVHPVFVSYMTQIISLFSPSTFLSHQLRRVYGRKRLAGAFRRCRKRDVWQFAQSAEPEYRSHDSAPSLGGIYVQPATCRPLRGLALKLWKVVYGALLLDERSPSNACFRASAGISLSALSRVHGQRCLRFALPYAERHTSGSPFCLKRVGRDALRLLADALNLKCNWGGGNHRTM